MERDQTLHCIENEIDKLAPLLHLLKDEIRQSIKKYEEEEKYEECSLLFRYDQNINNLLNIFHNFDHQQSP